MGRFKLIFADRYNFLSTAIFVLMGWMLLAASICHFAAVCISVSRWVAKK